MEAASGEAETISSRALHGIQGTIGVFGGESLLMSPFVPDLPQFTDVGSTDVAQLGMEDLVPVIPHDEKQGLSVESCEALFLG